MSVLADEADELDAVIGGLVAGGPDVVDVGASVETSAPKAIKVGFCVELPPRDISVGLTGPRAAGASWATSEPADTAAPLMFAVRPPCCFRA